MVADRLAYGEDELRIAAVHREAPEALCGILFHANHTEALAARHRRGGVLALAGAGDAGGAPVRDVVAPDVGLAVAADDCVEDRAAVGGEAGLVIVARTVRDVH